MLMTAASSVEFALTPEDEGSTGVCIGNAWSGGEGLEIAGLGAVGIGGHGGMGVQGLEIAGMGGGGGVGGGGCGGGGCGGGVGVEGNVRRSGAWGAV